MTIVMVGLNRPFVEAIEAHLEPGQLFVVESHEAMERRALAPFVEDHPAIGDIVEADYQLIDLDISALDDRLPSDVQAVVPGLEYSVRTAGRLAAKRGLPGAGARAAEVLQDKGAMRRAHAHSRYAVPAWEVGSAREVAEILAMTPGGVVLKPHNRQACVGVTRLAPGDDVEAAFLRVASEDVQVDKTADRPAALVEALVVGHQISAEALISNSRVLFLNVTDTLVGSGPQPVLLGQAVPSAVGPMARAHVSDAIGELVDRLGFGDGMLHAEFLWAEEHAELRLIECAGRPPGDRVVECIDKAFGINLHLALVQVLAGQTPELPDRPHAAAAVRFLDVDPAIEVLDIEPPPERELLDASADVQVHHRQRAAGISASGWERLANVLVIADDVATAVERADGLVGRFLVRTRSQDASPVPTTCRLRQLGSREMST